MLSATQGAMARAIGQWGHRSPVTPKREAATAPEGASQVSFSADGLRQAAEAARLPNPVSSRFRLDGTTGASLIRSPLTPAFKMPTDLVKEMAVRAEELTPRENTNARYASEYRYQTVGQVMRDGPTGRRGG